MPKISKASLNSFIALLVILLFLSACASQQPVSQPTPEDIQAAERQNAIFEKKQEKNFEEYCKEKYQDFKIGLSNAKNDLQEHTLDLADLQEEQAKYAAGSSEYNELQVDIGNKQARIDQDKKDISSNEQWIKETQAECADVLTEE